MGQRIVRTRCVRLLTHRYQLQLDSAILLTPVGCACAKLHLVSDSGLRRVGCDETHELIPRSGGSVRAVGIRHVDFARDGMARRTGADVGDRAALESRSGGEAFVALMKPADLRNRDHRAAIRRLDGASIRAVFVEREMGP